jgi:hypothetical protein
MPLQTVRAPSRPFTQADIPASAAAVRAATWEQALTDLPGSSIIRSFDLSFVGSLNAAPKYSAAEADYFMEERGLKGEFKFDRDYNELELNVLASRKRKELARTEILSRADGSGSSIVGRFGIQLASNLLDPIAIGTSFVPVIGQSKYALMLSNAGGKLGRAGVRASVGAAEGAVGATLVEPLIVGAKLQEQAEYRFADSFLNVTVGGILGGGLHTSLGAVGDALRPRELPSKALPTEAERIVPAEAREAVDVGAAAGPLDVVDEYHDAARRLKSAIRATRDIDLSNPAAVSKIAGRQVLSISQYVRETGGIIDDGGELSARDVTAKSMPGLVRKAGTAGADMDGVRERLFDSGYFPEKRDYNEISDTEVYDAIANDLAGERRYPIDVADLVAKVSEEKDFLARLESQGITRDMDAGQIAAKLRELDDDARELAPRENNDDGFGEYEQVMARETVDAADVPTREAALRVVAAQAAQGEAINVRPIFDRSSLMDAARRIDDPDSRPLTNPDSVRRADETLAGPDAIDAATITQTIADLQAQVKALQDEAGIDADKAAEFAAVIRADIEAAQQAQKDAKELGRAAAMLAACAVRSAA